jgi:hypothetical protein
MTYALLSNKDEEFAIRLSAKTFRTRIEFGWKPEPDFYGLAVICNYHFKDHPVGFIQDNNLIRTQVRSSFPRPTFEINNSTIIQAGPTLIQDGEVMTRKNGFKEGFPREIMQQGFHPFIGVNNGSSLILGFHKNANIKKLTDICSKYNLKDAIKLPGLNQGGFVFNNRQTHIHVGKEVFPIALIIEPIL